MFYKTSKKNERVWCVGALFWSRKITGLSVIVQRKAPTFVAYEQVRKEPWGDLVSELFENMLEDELHTEDPEGENGDSKKLDN